MAARTSSMLISVFLICFITSILAKTLSFEAESQTDRKYTKVSRSNASGKKAVHLFKGDTIYLEFCLTKESLLHVKDIKYSNDGGSDKLSVAIDNEPIGEFQTIGKYDGGKGWNKFRSLNNFTFSKTEHQGRHRLSISVIDADNFGVEIDMVLIEIPGSDQDISSFFCKIYCFDDIGYEDDLTQRTITQAKAKIVQRSVATHCAEEDNVNVPVFHESAKKFIVTANYPKYMSFSNNRGPDWRNCQTMSGPFWKFQDFSLLENVDIKHKTARVKANWTGTTGKIAVKFSLEGSSTGSTDSEIGTDIHLRLKWLPKSAIVSVSLSYLDRHAERIQSEVKQLNSTNLNVQWKTPDFTFKEGTENNIILTVWTTELADIQVKEFFMYKRNIEYDKSTTLYDDGMTVIEGVDMDMWWRINETMTVMLNDGNMKGNVDYLRVYQKVPWSYSGFAQVFVIYQDGNVRLLPMTPHGLDWVPFGSSVLLGQSDPHSFRPSAPIAHININPVNLNVKIFYQDGGVISLQIKATTTKTQLMISDAEYTKDLKRYPFITFRSMWVSDGNADVDHVTVDGAVTERILSDWTELRGTFVAFYRKCISKHNTLSPDISMKITH